MSKKKRIGKKKCIKLARDLYRGDKCDRCGLTKADGVQLQAAHIIPEEDSWLCCHPLNIMTMCASDHKWGIRSMHKNPLDFAKWFHQKYPVRYAQLLNLSKRFATESYRRTGTLDGPDWVKVYEILRLEKKLRKKK